MKNARKGKGREWLFSCPLGLAWYRIESHPKPHLTGKPASGFGRGSQAHTMKKFQKKSA
jgi:hypothetical protein